MERKESTGKRQRAIPIRIGEKELTAKQWAECLGVSYGWILAMKSRGDLEQMVLSGAVGKKKPGTVKIGDVFSGCKVISQEASVRGYRCYRVRHIETGKEQVVRGTKLLSGEFKGIYLGRPVNPPRTKLGYIYRKKFKDCDFSSWEDFESWAVERGYTDENSTPHLYDESKPFSRENVYFGIKGCLFECCGEVHNLSQWADILGISRQRVDQIHKNGQLSDYIEAKLTGKPMKKTRSGRPGKVNATAAENAEAVLAYSAFVSGNAVKAVPVVPSSTGLSDLADFCMEIGEGESFSRIYVSVYAPAEGVIRAKEFDAYFKAVAGNIRKENLLLENEWFYAVLPMGKTNRAEAIREDILATIKDVESGRFGVAVIAPDKSGALEITLELVSEGQAAHFLK